MYEALCAEAWPTLAASVAAAAVLLYHLPVLKSCVESLFADRMLPEFWCGRVYKWDCLYCEAQHVGLAHHDVV